MLGYYQLRYPDSCLEFKYDPTFPIRGLNYDKLKGCLLKLDFFGSIEPDGCYFGRRKVLFNEPSCHSCLLLFVFSDSFLVYID